MLVGVLGGVAIGVVVYRTTPCAKSTLYRILFQHETTSFDVSFTILYNISSHLFAWITYIPHFSGVVGTGCGPSTVGPPPRGDNIREWCTLSMKVVTMRSVRSLSVAAGSNESRSQKDISVPSVIRRRRSLAIRCMWGSPELLDEPKKEACWYCVAFGHDD